MSIEEEIRNLPKPPPSHHRGTLSNPALNTESIRSAMIESKGDLFTAAALLNMKVRSLNSAIKISPGLQQTVLAIEKVAEDPEYLQMASKQFDAAVRERMLLYRIDGLDALHELAVMPIDENHDMMKVKLSAASKLAGTDENVGGQASSEMSDILRTLNEAYQEHAPRIRIIRQMSVELQDHDEKLIASI